MYASIEPAKFCHTEYKAPGTVAKVKSGKCVFARLVDKPEFWKAISIAMVIICLVFTPDKYARTKPNNVPKEYCKIITTIIIRDELMIASLFAPITPATIVAITIEDKAGKKSFNFSQNLGNL
ncbi:hypothetical protein YLM1_0184 [Methanobrevibacter olleyae]|uniref:Uncharacterized protein n=1 Tax=Methanobrevibacter olleyae TaxID=294671 RepID=A0A126QY56_METOL|nr:hypothetical protein YLM1_0184 [Methanobrevibacter olleyae]